MRNSTSSSSVQSPSNHKEKHHALIEAAQSKVQAGNYKDAIELYKTLLKTNENPEWRQALALCYLQRALSFSAKGMYKEAVVLWESYASNNKAEAEYFDHYIIWLLQSQNIAKVKKCLQQLTVQQLDVAYPELACILGLLALSNKLDVQGLPQESLFIKHLALAKAILAAYRANQIDVVTTHLQTLPFRSAFKDFRAVMNAVLLLSTSKEQAQSQLAKISPQSPYRNFADSVLAITHDGLKLVQDLQGLSYIQAQLVGTAKGFSKKQLELLDVVLKQKSRLNDKLKFNLALQYQTLWQADFLKRYCYSALGNYPAGQRDFIKQFGQFDEFEECRLKALGYERKNNKHDAKYYWQRAVTLLQNKPQIDNFKIAALMRHIALMARTISDTVTWLENSLRYDPDDRDTYLKILQQYENVGQYADAYKQWLDKSIRHFPQDVEFLLLSITDAVNRQAFDDVERYAHSVLKIDSVNLFAKRVLFDNQLARVRTLIKTNQLKQLAIAMQAMQALALNKRDHLVVSIMQGFCEFTSNKSQGAALIADTVQQLQEGLLTAHFYVMMEASLMSLQLAPVLKALPKLNKDYSVSSGELKQFTGLILQYANTVSNLAAICKMIDKVKAPIKQAINRNQYSEEELLAFCQGLERVNQFELMRASVKYCESESPSPIWMYYRVYAAVNGDPAKCSHMDMGRLMLSLNRAMEDKDERAIVLIRKFVEKCFDSKDMPDDWFYDEEDEENDDDDPMALFEYLPLDLYKQLDKKAAEYMNKNPPERLLPALMKQYFPNNAKAVMQQLFENFDLLQALLFLKAADELKIDVQITADDILSRAKGNVK